MWNETRQKAREKQMTKKKKKKMVAIRSNTPKRRNKQTMVEELMSLVNEEEYVDTVQRLSEDDYLTKTEIASMRKMLSGKLWN